DPVENALRQEVHQITKKLGGRAVAADKPAHRGQKRLGFLVKRHRNSIQRDWLHHSQSDPGHRRLKLSAQKRTSPVLPLVDEALKSMKFTPKAMTHMKMKAATQHGGLRGAPGLLTSLTGEKHHWKIAQQGRRSKESRSRSSFWKQEFRGKRVAVL